MGFSKNGHMYRVYFFVHMLIPEEGFIDQYYIDTPSNDEIIEDIIRQRPHLETYKAKIQVLNIDPIVHK